MTQTMTLVLKWANRDFECHMCGKRLPRGQEYGHLTGTTGKADHMKVCGFCSALYLPEPENFAEFYMARPGGTHDPSAEECLDIIDSGRCDASCITADSESTSCECRCAGFFHGALRTAIIST